MSSPPSQPPQQAFNLSNRNSTGDRDAPGEGRLAAVGNTVRGPAPSNITRLGTQKMKFTPKAVPKKVTEETASAKQSPLIVDGSSNTAPARGRGRGRGKDIPPPISGPFAAGPPGARERRTTRQTRAVQGTSITGESSLGKVQAEPGVVVSSSSVTKEGETPGKPVASSRKTAKKSKVKTEDDDVRPLPESLGEMDLDDNRVNLAEMDLPGGPVSSHRKHDRNIRGWKKIELWMEDEARDEFTTETDDIVPASQNTHQQDVIVKTEDEVTQDTIALTPNKMLIDSDGDSPMRATIAAQRRQKRRRRKILGKTEEQQEELALEEADRRLLQTTFLDEDEFEREEKLFLLQLPSTLPPLQDVKEAAVKVETKPSDSAVSAPEATAVIPSGKIGQIRVHASGKSVLSYGGINFPIRLASDVMFAQDFVVIDATGQKKAWRLGNVGGGQQGGWLIGVPDLRGIQ